MSGRFEGRVAVVTGGGAGIGLAVARRLVSEGARLLLADIDLERAQMAAGTLAAGGPEVIARGTDVTQPADVQAMLEAAANALGGIDIVCNNAGVLTADSDFESVRDEMWERTLSTNLRGVILGCKYALPHLRRRGGGAIVNTASMAGVVGLATDPVYAASKAGVIALTRSLGRLEAQAGIRVTCVCPSFVDTAMVRDAAGAHRAAFAGFALLSADDVAQTIVFLASDEAAGLGGRAVRLVAGEEPRLLGGIQLGAAVG